jgi:hypothetical protein
MDKNRITRPTRSDVLGTQERPRCGAGPRRLYRLISTSTPGRRSLLISTSGSLTRRRSSTVTSGSRTVLPTVTSGVRVQFSPQSGPTQFRSHTSAALTGSERRAEPVNAAATAKTRAVRISNLHEFFDTRQRPGEDGVPGSKHISYDPQLLHRISNIGHAVRTILLPRR